MTETAPESGQFSMDRETFALVGDLMAASADQLAWTNAQLQAYERRRGRDILLAIIDVERVLCEIPQWARTEPVNDALMLLGHQISMHRDLLKDDAT